MEESNMWDTFWFGFYSCILWYLATLIDTLSFAPGKTNQMKSLRWYAI